MNKTDFIRGCVCVCMIIMSFLSTFFLGCMCKEKDENDTYLIAWIFSCVACGVLLTVIIWKYGVI